MGSRERATGIGRCTNGLRRSVVHFVSVAGTMRAQHYNVGRASAQMDETETEAAGMGGRVRFLQHRFMQAWLSVCAVDEDGGLRLEL